LNTDASCALASGGVATHYTYTPENQVDVHTDALGNVTDTAFNNDEQPSEVYFKDSGGTTRRLVCMTYDANERMQYLTQSTTLTDCTGNKTKFEYSGNQMSAIVNPRFSGAGTPKTTYTYNSAGRVLTITDELGLNVTYTYNARGQVLTTKDNLNNVTAQTYDAVGNLKTVIDALGNTTSYSYDNANRLITVTDALSGITTYGYDANGNRTAITNARSKTTTYAYDALNRLTSVTDPLSRTTSYAYDAAGNRTQVTDARSLVTKYFYDAARRNTSVEYWDGAALVGGITYT
jgi:YD repeat-containing protein